MSKNQIWVVIAIFAIGVIALVSDIQIKFEVGTEDYTSIEDCIYTKMQKCPNGNGDCTNAAEEYCLYDWERNRLKEDE